MRVVYPVSTPTIPYVDISSTHVVFRGLIDSDYLESVSEKSEKGHDIIMVDSVREGMVESVFPYRLKVWSYFRASSERAGEDIAVPVEPILPSDSVDWYKGYQLIVENPEVKAVAIQPGDYTGTRRVRFIKALVERGIFSRDVEHWLWGVSQPAELSVYPRLFSGHILSGIPFAVCPVCFIASMHGVRFSIQSGILEMFPGHNPYEHDLGMLGWQTYYPNRDQLREFYYNVDIVNKLASGVGGGEYFGRLELEMESDNEKASVL